MKWSLAQIAEWTGGKVLSSKTTDFSEIGTDTRKNLTGQIFIALKGDSFDAHDYLDKAVQAGAAALLVHSLPEKFESLKSQTSIILVNDTLKALQDFSHHYRKSLKTKIIGITGSNGKTTTKEFTAQILGQYKKTHYSQGSFNNHWGVPMTLLSIPQDADFAVVEMGMNHAGEITQLVHIAEPDIVVCTMVGTAHIEFFGTQANIAKAKSEIYLDSKPETIRIFNQDQDLTFDMMYPVSRKFPESRLRDFINEGAGAAALEVSSHALEQKRAHSVHFNTVIFTNLTLDHLDYHKTMNDYFAAKQKLFTDLMWITAKKPKFAVINVDDSYGRKLKVAEEVFAWTYGQKDADFQFKILSMNFSETE